MDFNDIIMISLSKSSMKSVDDVGVRDRPPSCTNQQQV